MSNSNSDLSFLSRHVKYQYGYEWLNPAMYEFVFDTVWCVFICPARSWAHLWNAPHWNMCSPFISADPLWSFLHWLIAVLCPKWIDLLPVLVNKGKGKMCFEIPYSGCCHWWPCADVVRSWPTGQFQKLELFQRLN